MVTSFLFQAHPVSTVYAGPIFWEATHARAVMRAYRDFLPTAPEELGAFVGLKTVPSMDPFPREYWGKRACAVISSYNGPAAEGEKVDGADCSSACRRRSSTGWATMPFPAMQALFDPFFPKGLQWYWKGDFVKSLPDEAIDAHIAQAAEGAERAVADAPLSDRRRRPPRRRRTRPRGAHATRPGRWSSPGSTPNPQKAEALKAWGRAYWEAVHPFNLEGAYVNFMMDDEAEGRVQATYGDNYARLAAVKAKYDPDNLFRVNQNIRPAA